MDWLLLIIGTVAGMVTIVPAGLWIRVNVLEDRVKALEGAMLGEKVGRSGNVLQTKRVS